MATVPAKPLMLLKTDQLCFMLLGSLILLIRQGIALAATNHKRLFTHMNHVDEVSSPGFPTACCSPFSFTIETISGEQPGYIRMTFSDLDLPEGSLLQIFDGASASPAALFPDQPEIRRGVWSRPSIATTRAGRSIHVKFIPPSSANGTDVSYENFVGFKASFWVTNSPPDSWTDKAIKDACTPILNPAAGERIIQRVMDFDEYLGTTTDCIWQLKVPKWSTDDVLKPEDLEAYVRFLTLDFTGYLDVREGLSSDGKVLLSVDTSLESANTSAQPEKGFSSSKGLYIHMTILNEGTGAVEFVYGLLHTQDNIMRIGSNPRSCLFGGWGEGFRCESNGQSWCIPSTHACNGVKNCPDGKDENQELACPPSLGAVQPPTRAVISGGKAGAPKGCGPNKAMCTDWTCDKVDGANCLKSGGKKCDADEHIWCPGEGCIDTVKYGFDCFGYCGSCPDGTCSLDGQCPGLCPKVRKTCEDGSCASPTKGCPEKCSSWERRCPNGNCLSKMSLCAEEVCMESYLVTCDDRRNCYNKYHMCDKYPDCNDGSDEKNCYGNMILNWIVVGPITAAALAFCCFYKYKKKRAPRARTAYHSIVGRQMSARSDADRTAGVPATGPCPHPSPRPPPDTRGGSSHHPPPAQSVPSVRVTDYELEPVIENDEETASASPTGPPGYTEVLQNNDTYKAPSKDAETPPPTYDTVDPSI